MKSIIPNCHICKKSQLKCICTYEDVENEDDSQFSGENVDDVLKYIDLPAKQLEKQALEAEKARVRARNYVLKNKDNSEWREAQKRNCNRYYASHREICKAKYREYYAKNKDKVRERRKKYYQRVKLKSEGAFFTYP